MLLLLLVFACFGYAVHTWLGVAALRHKEPPVDPAPPGQALANFIVPAAVPAFVLLTMVWLFWMVGVAQTVQLNVNDEGRMDAWSTWVRLWEFFLLLTAVSGAGNLIWSIACAVKKRLRSHLVTALAALGLSVLAFFTVATHFPSA